MKVKAQSGIQLTRDINTSKKSILKVPIRTKEDKGKDRPFTERGGELMFDDMKKAEVLNPFFTSVFTKGQLSDDWFS